MPSIITLNTLVTPFYGLNFSGVLYPCKIVASQYQVVAIKH